MQESIIQKSNKEFAFTCIRELFCSPNMDEEKLNILLDHERCKRHIGEGFRTAILKEVSADCTFAEIQELCKDGTKQARHYAIPVRWNGRFFLITNYWYGPKTRQPDNKTPFYHWVVRNL